MAQSARSTGCVEFEEDELKAAKQWDPLIFAFCGAITGMTLAIVLEVALLQG